MDYRDAVGIAESSLRREVADHVDVGLRYSNQKLEYTGHL